MNNKRLMTGLAVVVVIALGANNYFVESEHYTGVQDDAQIERWLQTAHYMKQTIVVSDKQDSRDIFSHDGQKKKVGKRKTKNTKAKNKYIKKTPAIVVGVASRLRCLAVAKQGEQWTAYMTLDGESHMVKHGDIINNQVRILDIGESGVNIEDVKGGQRSLVPVLGA